MSGDDDGTETLTDGTRRPEWIRCVVDKHMDRKGLAWCGRSTPSLAWSFVDVDHVAQNGRAGGRLVVCPECLKAIESALRNGHEEPSHDEA